jgi:hypothetical protein
MRSLLATAMVALGVIQITSAFAADINIRPDRAARGAGGLVPFCLPGEKRVCTLGPPPVCHCELIGTGGTAIKKRRR